MKQYDFINDPESNDENAVVVNDAPKRKLDIWPRLICLFIAIGVWLYMVNLNDTSVPSTITLTVNIDGVEALKDKGMMIYGYDKTTVTVTIKGSNRDLNKYSEDDYRASVNVGNINASGKHTLPIEITTPSGSSISVDNLEPLNMVIYSDESLTKTIPFDWVKGDVVTIPTYSYSIEKSADFIKISGPKSVIETIESAKYIIEGEFYSSKTFTGFTDIKFCDKNGDYVSYGKDLVSYSSSDINVYVNVLTKKSVPISVSILGGGSLVGTATPGTVTLIGDPLVLSEIDKYIIYLTEAYIDRAAQVTLTSGSDQFKDGVTIEEEGATVLITFDYVQN